MFELFLGYFIQLRYRTFKCLGHQVVTRIYYERSIEAIYVYWFTTGSARSDLMTVRSNSGKSSSRKSWQFWIATIAEAKRSWYLVEVMNLLSRDSSARCTCRRSRNGGGRVKSILVIVTFNCSVGVCIVHGQHDKTGLNLLYSMKKQCWLRSSASSRGINHLFVTLLVQKLL